MKLEFLVRPFQTTTVSPSPTPGAGTKFAPPVVAHFTATGGTASFAFSESSSRSTRETPGQTYKEVKRDNQKVRIKNPDDKDQHVDVLRAKKIEFVNEMQPSAKIKTVYSYDYGKDTGAEAGEVGGGDTNTA